MGPGDSEASAQETIRRQAEELAALRLQNATFAEQVKRLVKAEGQLYRYQEQLDAQLREYRELYLFHRRLNAAADLSGLFACALEFVIDKLGYERVLFLYRQEGNRDFTVCALDGYYTPAEKLPLLDFVLSGDSPLLASLLADKGCVVYAPSLKLPQELALLGERLLLDEYLLYPLGSVTHPQALLIVGNSRENAGFYRRVEEGNQALLGIGNLAGLLSIGIENLQFHEELERRVAERTGELQRANAELRSLSGELEVAYANLQTTQSRMLQREKMASIGQLAAGVAHEINNPMGFILSNLNTLQKYAGRLTSFLELQSGVVDELVGKSGLSDAARQLGEQRKALKLDYVLKDLEGLIGECQEGAERVKKIVQELKTFSRLDESERQQANLNGGLESTLKMVWNELKYKAELATDFGDIPAITCNPGQLNQVFMNLLVNAAQAIESHGTIGVKTRSDENYVYVTISDSGHGIAPENLPRIFEPFYTTKEVGKGTGLGLSIAYDIVKQHNGEIRVESEPGTGTAFTLILPVDPAEPA
jgi:signal transduction histidine kinase